MIQLPKIYLASKSPRRREILTNAGFQIELISIEVDEDYSEDLKPEKVAEYISNKKINEVKQIPADGIILTADTIVILDHVILGKPENKEHAIEMLKMLANKEHDVITGVSLKSSLNQKSFSVLSKVTVDDLTISEIDFYLDHFHPFDKAGSYGIQDWLGMCKVSHLKGSYYNVMGLPIYEVYKNINLYF